MLFFSRNAIISGMRRGEDHEEGNRNPIEEANEVTVVTGRGELAWILMWRPMVMMCMNVIVMGMG